jgi:hypothetical protein
MLAFVHFAQRFYIILRSFYVGVIWFILVLSSLPCDGLFIHLLADEHLFGFQLLVIMDKAAINIHLFTGLCGLVFSFLLNRYLGIVLLDNVVGVLSKQNWMFSKLIVSFYILKSSMWELEL